MKATRMMWYAGTALMTLAMLAGSATAVTQQLSVTSHAASATATEDSSRAERRRESNLKAFRGIAAKDKFAHPYQAAARGYLDDIIDPRDTRPRLIEALTTLATKRDKNPPKKHGNIPL